MPKQSQNTDMQSFTETVVLADSIGATVITTKMTTFTGRVSRDLARQWGEDVVKICSQGTYISPSGCMVNIKDSLDRAVNGTKSYDQDAAPGAPDNGQHSTQISVTNETTLSAAKRLIDKGIKTVLLNFASATTPGGGFLSGAIAQEEYLARSSGLYACIQNNPMYRYNREHWNPFYSDFMIYSPDVPVMRADDGQLLEEPYSVSMITAAAPNANKVPSERHIEIGPVLWRRMEKFLAIGVEHKYEGIVLGAWGCGAFGNDGVQVARLFKKALNNNFRGAFKNVVFAIVDWSPERQFIGPFEKELSPAS